MKLLKIANPFLLIFLLASLQLHAEEGLDQQSDLFEEKLLKLTSDLYLSSFESRVNEFNRERYNLKKYLTNKVKDKNKKVEILNYLDQQKVNNLPAIIKSKEGYSLVIGTHKIFLTPEMAIKNQIQLNSQLVQFDKDESFNDLEVKVKTILMKKTSWIDFIISPAYAVDESFFNEIMGALISMNQGMEFGKWFGDDEKLRWAKKLRSDVTESLSSCREEADSSSGSFREEKGTKKIDSVFVNSSSPIGKLLSKINYGDSKALVGYKENSEKMMKHMKSEYSKSFSNKNGANNNCINFQSAISGDDLTSPSTLEKLKNIRAYAAQDPDGVAKEPGISNDAAMFCNDMMELQACMNVFQDKTVRTRWADGREKTKVYQPGSGEDAYGGKNSSISK